MPLLNQRNRIALIGKTHWKELLAVFFLLLSVYFFRQERHELRHLIPFIEKADKKWVLAGIIVTGIYLLLQAGLLVYSFSTVQARLDWPSSLLLFLKQNFLSVFLPGGGIATYIYLPAILRRKNIEKHRIFQAGGIQGFIGILTVVMVGLPVILYAAFSQKFIRGASTAFAGACLLVISLTLLVAAFRKKGKVFRWFINYFPASQKHIESLFSFRISGSHFFFAILFSLGIEVAGALHLYIAMLACGATASPEAALTGYIVSTLFLVISPFLKGLGMVELSLVYVLKLYGYPTVTALEITLLYRCFEFWLPFAAGLAAWAWKARDLFLRLLPPSLIFILGVVNIFSVLTPPIASRLHILKEYLPVSSIHASNAMVILLGLILIITAAFLVRGLKAAWWMAFLFSVLSLLGHLTKALDYEESLLALTVVLVLLFSRNQYRLKSNALFFHIGLVTAVAALIVLLIFNTVGYHFLDGRHFGLQFTWQQSFYYAFTDLLLIRENPLHPVTSFGSEFIHFIRVSGFAVWIFLFYTLIRPYIRKVHTGSQSRDWARLLLDQYGTSALDHFKIDPDKLLFVSPDQNGFISYKIAHGFAIVLEEPVCAEKHKIPMLTEFERLCRKMGLKPAFYRVDEESLYYFSELKKKKLLIGQEGIMQVKDFTLEGRQYKSLRNSLNSLNKKGYTVQLHTAPLSAGLIRSLKQVSDEWLKAYNKSETVFSQGRFDETAISRQDIIALHDRDGEIAAFLNIIPDYSPDECTYDLIRKNGNTPGGAMDALVIKLAEYARQKGLTYLNLGLVPMSGINEPSNTAERVVKYAYEKIRRFRYYQGLREFKEKYASYWVNKYLIYENDFDLVQLPAALNKVMQPGKLKNFSI